MSQQLHPLFATDLSSVRVLLSETPRNQADRRTPRSRPEQSPSLDAAETKEQFERAIGKGEDASYHLLDRPEAVKALSAALEVSRREAEELLDLGSEGVEPVAPYSGEKGKGKSFKADDLESWAERYRSQKEKKTADESKPNRKPRGIVPHFPAMTQATAITSPERTAFDDVDSVAAGRSFLFGDSPEHDRFRQGSSQFLGSDFFRSDSFRR